MQHLYLISLPAVAITLAACGSGGDSTPPLDPRYFSGPDDSMSMRINAATSREEATPFHTSAKVLERDFDSEAGTGVARQLPDESMIVRLFRTMPEGMPSLVIEKDSGELSFGPEHEDDNNFRMDNYGSWAWGRDWLAQANGYRLDDDGIIDIQDRKHHIPFSISSWLEDEERAIQHIAVIGIETAPRDMPQLKTAHYDGRGRLEVWPVNDPLTRERMSFYINRVSLTANFADDTISGSLNEWEVRVGRGDRTPIGSVYDLFPTAIDGNGFSTSLSPSASCSDICPTMPDSNVEGRFYGPYATEVGGTIETREFSHDGRDWIGLGVIYTAD